MAKRRRKETKKFNTLKFFEDNRTNLIRGFWAFTVILCILFGYSRGYPLVAAGQVWNGILLGLAWGMGAFLAIAFSYYLNRKLKGL